MVEKFTVVNEWYVGIGAAIIISKDCEMNIWHKQATNFK